jgi:hypothetical protein
MNKILSLELLLLIETLLKSSITPIKACHMVSLYLLIKGFVVKPFTRKASQLSGLWAFKNKMIEIKLTNWANENATQRWSYKLSETQTWRISSVCEDSHRWEGFHRRLIAWFVAWSFNEILKSYQSLQLTIKLSLSDQHDVAEHALTIFSCLFIIFFLLWLI